MSMVSQDGWGGMPMGWGQRGNYGKFDSPKYGWHDVLGKWTELSEIDKPQMAEI